MRHRILTSGEFGLDGLWKRSHFEGSFDNEIYNHESSRRASTGLTIEVSLLFPYLLFSFHLSHRSLYLAISRTRVKSASIPFQASSAKSSSIKSAASGTPMSKAPASGEPQPMKSPPRAVAIMSSSNRISIASRRQAVERPRSQDQFEEVWAALEQVLK